MGANERQVGGSHYKKPNAVEHWDIVVQWDLDYFQGQITKYVMRWRDKGGLQDLEKAAHFLEKYREVEASKALAKEFEDITKSTNKFWGNEGNELRKSINEGKEVPRRKVSTTRKR